MSRRRMLTIAVTATFVLGCFHVGYGMFCLPTIPPHRGDGSFQDLSRRAGPFALPGYCISMAEFDLARSHEAEYHFTALPNIGRKCGVHLAIRDHDGRWWGTTRHLNGKLTLELLNSEGHKVVAAGGRLGDYIWWGFSDLHALYQMEKSFFTPDGKQEYRLRVSYEPDDRLAGYMGFVYVRSGGNM